MYNHEMMEPKKDYNSDIDAMRKAMNSLTVKENSKPSVTHHSYDVMATPVSTHHAYNEETVQPQHQYKHVTNKQETEQPQERNKNRNKIMQPSFSFSNVETSHVPQQGKHIPLSSPTKEKANLDLIKYVKIQHYQMHNREQPVNSTSQLEKELLDLSLEKDSVEREYQKLLSQGVKTLTSRKRRVELEEHTERLVKSISRIKLRLRDMLK